MSAVHYVPGDGNPTQDAEVKVPDSSVGGDPMIPVSKYQHYGNGYEARVSGSLSLGTRLESVVASDWVRGKSQW